MSSEALIDFRYQTPIEGALALSAFVTRDQQTHSERA
jgi:hypothetical protein